MGPRPRLARRLDGVQPHQLAISLPKGQRHQNILAVGPHGVEVLAGGAQPAQLEAVHHRESGLQHMSDIDAFRHGPVDVERHGDRAALAVGEIIVRGVGRVERLGAERGEHMHQRGPLVVHSHHLTPHIRDKRALLGDHRGIDRFGDPVVFLGQRQLEQSLLAAHVMQHAGLGEPHFGGDTLQRRAVIAEFAKRFDGGGENRGTAIGVGGGGVVHTGNLTVG